MGIKIKTIKIDGEDRIPPKCMELLLKYGDHKKKCLTCEIAEKMGNFTECREGQQILDELVQQPEVEPYED